MKLLLANEFIIESFLEGRPRWRFRIRNAATDAGLNDLLSAGFAAGTQRPAWYLGLIDNDGFSAIPATDTLSSHPGWTEVTAYTSATRPQWTPLSVAGKLVQNTSVVNFTMNATKTLRGIFVASDSTKGGTSGILWATALLPSTQQVVNSQVVKVTYGVQATAQ